MHVFGSRSKGGLPWPSTAMAAFGLVATELSSACYVLETYKLLGRQRIYAIVHCIVHRACNLVA